MPQSNPFRADRLVGAPTILCHIGRELYALFRQTSGRVRATSGYVMGLNHNFASLFGITM